MRNQLIQARQQIAYLARENACLKQDNSHLRARAGCNRTERIVVNARRDAELILHLRHSGINVSRRWLESAGLVSGFRYGWALGLLRACRLDRIIPKSIEHLQQCVKRLSNKASNLLADNDLDLLRARSGKRYYRNRYA